MSETYFLWHCQRQGWISKSGTTTIIEDAQGFPLDVAVKRVADTRDHTGSVTMVPVNKDHVV